jgi:hypothetical protein
LTKPETPKKGTAGMKDTKLASQGLVSELRNAPFIGGHHACKAPARAMIRYSQNALISCVDGGSRLSMDRTVRPPSASRGAGGMKRKSSFRNLSAPIFARHDVALRAIGSRGSWRGGPAREGFGPRFTPIRMARVISSEGLRGRTGVNVAPLLRQLLRRWCEILMARKS